MTSFVLLPFMVFIVFFIIQLYFFECIMKPVNSYFRKKNLAKSSSKHSEKPISVIICAKNEAPNLQRFLPKVLEQNYSDFEVLVIDDDSDDETAILLQKMAEKYSSLRHITIKAMDRPADWNPKKWALQQGINMAKYETLLLTDADCYPSSPYWIANMAASLSTGKEVILGFSFYEKKRTLLNKIIQFETFQTALLYAGFSLKQKAYMAVGRNLMYTKRFFKSVDGFSGLENITGGDDDLLIQKIEDQQIIDICLQPKATTISLPEETFRQYHRQKIRHLNAGKYYKKQNKWLLALFYASQIAFWPLAAILLLTLNSLQYIWLIAVIMLYISRQYVLYKNFSTKFELFQNISINPMVEILYSWIMVLQGAGTFFSKRIRWK